MKKFIQYLQMVSEMYTVQQKKIFIENDTILKLKDLKASRNNMIEEIAKKINDPYLNISLKSNYSGVSMWYPQGKDEFPKGIYIINKDNHYSVQTNDDLKYGGYVEEINNSYSTNSTVGSILNKLENINKYLLKKVYGLIVINVETEIFYVDNKSGDSKKSLIKFLNQNYKTFKNGDIVEIDFLYLKLDERLLQNDEVLKLAEKWGEKKFPDATFSVDFESDTMVAISFRDAPVYTSWMSDEFLKAGIPPEDVKKIMKKINNYTHDDYEFKDNERIHITKNGKDIYGSEKKYDSDYNDGCCGFVDDKFKVGDYDVKFGFNYGH